MGEFKELITELLGWEHNKVMRTLKGLTISPGKTIQYFADGNRKSYVHALSYFLGMVGLISFLAIYLPESNIENKINELQQNESHERLAKLKKGTVAYKEMEHVIEQKQSIDKYFQNRQNTSIIMYGFVFVYSLLHLLVFNNLTKGLRNNVWFILYIFAHGSLISFVLSVPGYLIHNIYLSLFIFLIAFVISFVYRIWACKQFYAITLGRAILKNIYISLILTFIPLFIGFFITLYISFRSHN